MKAFLSGLGGAVAAIVLLCGGAFVWAQSTGGQDVLGQLVVGIQGVSVVPNPIGGAVLVYSSPLNRWVPLQGNQFPTTCVHSGGGIIYSNSGVLTVC